MRVTMRDCTELFFCPIFYWINTTVCISGYKIIGRHRKQHYGKSQLCYSDYIKTLLSKDHPRIITLATVFTVLEKYMGVLVDHGVLQMWVILKDSSTDDGTAGPIG